MSRYFFLKGKIVGSYIAYPSPLKNRLFSFIQLITKDREKAFNFVKNIEISPPLFKFKDDFYLVYNNYITNLDKIIGKIFIDARQALSILFFYDNIELLYLIKFPYPKGEFLLSKVEKIFPSIYLNDIVLEENALLANQFLNIFREYFGNLYWYDLIYKRKKHSNTLETKLGLQKLPLKQVFVEVNDKLYFASYISELAFEQAKIRQFDSKKKKD